jgi:hypothetical protein
LKRFFKFSVICALGIVMSAPALSSQEQPMNIRVQANGKTFVFQLNDSTASKELHAQLPLEVKVDNFGGNEKIFYPPKKLNTDHTPLANSIAGSLAYYAPWGDVVMFYQDFGKASGLFELGHAVSGTEYIRSLSGTISITGA